MYLTVTMLFRISAIQVQTADGTQVTEIAGYSADSILQTLGVQVEENIFSFDSGAKAAELERQYPLLESIRVVRDYPNTVVVQVTEATPTYAVQAGSSWLTLSDKFKILSADPAQPDGLCTLYGGEATTAAPGEQLSFAAPEADSTAGTSAASDSSASGVVDETDAKMSALATLQTKLDEYGMRSDVTRIEFADTEQIAFLYQDRISVLLGTLNDLDYKLDRARYMLNRQHPQDLFCTGRPGPALRLCSAGKGGAGNAGGDCGQQPDRRRGPAGRPGGGHDAGGNPADRHRPHDCQRGREPHVTPHQCFGGA